MPESPCSRSFAPLLASRSNVCSCSTYAVRMGRETERKPVLSSGWCFLSSLVPQVLHHAHQLQVGVVLGERQRFYARALGGLLCRAAFRASC
eukprot:6200502-Pleurochrysis_carterae.AAC.2